MPSVHPTAAALVRATVDLLDTTPPADITVDMVLDSSGVSKGSLYHHFRDFPELMDRAQVLRFGRTVDASIEQLTAVLTRARTREECYIGLVAITEASQGPATKDFRRERVWTLAQAGTREAARDLLGAEQQRLTDAIEDLVHDAQHKGWVRRELDARSIAVFIQAYTLGQVIDDVSPRQVDTVAWRDLVNTVIRDAFLTRD
jgi:AcrR family transcriptional regulator